MTKVKSKNIQSNIGIGTTIELGDNWTIVRLSDGKLSFKYKGYHQFIIEPVN